MDFICVVSVSVSVSVTVSVTLTLTLTLCLSAPRSFLSPLSSLSRAYLFDDVERLYQWLIERRIDLCGGGIVW